MCLQDTAQVESSDAYEYSPLSASWYQIPAAGYVTKAKILKLVFMGINLEVQATLGLRSHGSPVHCARQLISKHQSFYIDTCRVEHIHTFMVDGRLLPCMA